MCSLKNYWQETRMNTIQRYWSKCGLGELSYDLNLERIIAKARTIKWEIIRRAIREIRSRTTDPISDLDLAIVLGTTPIGKGILFTRHDLVGLHSTTKEPSKDYSEYLRIVLGPGTPCCVPPMAPISMAPNLHDLIGHEIIDWALGESNLDKPDSVWTKDKLGVHYMFSRLLSVLFKQSVEQGLTRTETVEYMTDRLVKYLRAESLLISKGDGLAKLIRPYSELEARMAINYHSRELLVSFYEPHLYTRYRKDDPYKEMPEGLDLLSASPSERLTLLRNLDPYKPTLYQDSFYVRDLVLQKALHSI